jgi:antitoxin component of RelBE/YafQ-DinJ toxin-antitoxin module
MSVNTFVTTRPVNFRLEEEILAQLQAIKERDGVPVSEQVRRALQAWIAEKGVTKQKSERPRAVKARKRS